MSLLSVFRKNKQESSAGNSEFYSLADEEKPPRKRRASAKRDEPVDPVLPEKKRARRRLVGAIALVLAAVIGLPMILDSEPKPLSDNIAIQIPSRDGVAPLPAAKPAATKHAEAAATDALEANEEIVQPSKPAVAPAAPAAAPSAASKAPAADKPEADSKPHAAAKTETIEPKPSATPPSRADADAARARAILEGKTSAAASAQAKSSGKVAVQVAALATEDKVRELQKKLQGAGLKSYTQKVATQSGGHVIRVRVGPFANDAEAEKARAKLIKIGLNGKLVPA